MEWCWFPVLWRHFSTSPVLFSSGFSAPAFWLPLSHYLISFVLIPCLSPVSSAPPSPFLHQTLILCDVKLITQPAFPVSAPLSGGCDCGALGGLWCVFVGVCVCVWNDDGMLRDSWEVRERVWLQMEVTACHLLSAVFRTGRFSHL